MTSAAAHPDTFIRQFYADFEAGRAEAVLSYLHPEVSFTDPIFGRLQGREVRALIHMLAASRTADRRFVVHSVRATEQGATVNWTAHYTFAGRPVTNVIITHFVLKGERIRAYEDQFNLNAWMSMALGPVGRLLGWTPWLRGKVRSQVRQRLEKAMATMP